MTHTRRNLEALCTHLTEYDRVLEVGIGRRHDVAQALAAAGVSVVATDIYPRDVPPTVTFVEDDIVEPTLAVYEGVDAIYALNLPPELQRPTLTVARTVDAAFFFTTLGTDPPVVPVAREPLGWETLYVARH